MGTTIVIVIAAMIVVSVFAILISLRMSVAKAAKRSRAERSTQQQAGSTALWAGALIVDSRGGAAETAVKARMTLTLEVTPSAGAPYRTSVVWLVDLSALHLTAAGSQVPVRLDAVDPQKVYPAVPWASYVSR